MQTLRKLPTMQPKVKKTKDQKWNGTSIHWCGSKIGLTPINVMHESAAHDFKGRGLAGPDFQSARALMKQHADAVGGAATSFARGFEQRGLSGTIDHIVNGAR